MASQIAIWQGSLYYTVPRLHVIRNHILEVSHQWLSAPVKLNRRYIDIYRLPRYPVLPCCRSILWYNTADLKNCRLDFPDKKSIKIRIKEKLILILISFCIVLVGSCRSKAFCQSYWLLITAALPSLVSSSLKILSTIQTSICSAPITFFPPNWLKLSLSNISSRIIFFKRKPHISYIRHKDFLLRPAPSCSVTLRVPPWILKRAGLESSGRIASSSY